MKCVYVCYVCVCVCEGKKTERNPYAILFYYILFYSLLSYKSQINKCTNTREYCQFVYS